MEIETCASGGGRVDLGVLARTDRVWARDCNDALERQRIQRWTELLLPPELIGSHVGPAAAHTTGRTHDLAFRAATALFGHLGIEWDIAAAGDDELDGAGPAGGDLPAAPALLHAGDVVHADHPDPAVLVHGVVAPDRSAAVFAYVAPAPVGRRRCRLPARLPGLDAGRSYRVTLRRHRQRAGPLRPG